MNSRELFCIVIALVLGASLAGLSFALDSRVPSPYVLGALAFLSFVMLLLLVLSPPTPVVDIWDLQRKLMTISDQQTPATPHLTDSGLLYYALTMEELSEQGTYLARVLDRRIEQLQRERGPVFTRDAHAAVAMIAASARVMASSAVNIRAGVAKLTGLKLPLTRVEARHLLDDLTDQAVTVAGGSVAMGLPGAAGYREVQRSNFSKANPSTGRIDKEPSGKWIKGINYRDPDLDAVLDQV